MSEDQKGHNFDWANYDQQFTHLGIDFDGKAYLYSGEPEKANTGLEYQPAGHVGIQYAGYVEDYFEGLLLFKKPEVPPQSLALRC